jgi:hypothetical protein
LKSGASFNLILFKEKTMDARICVYSGNALDWERLDFLSTADGFVAALKDSDPDDHDPECEWHDDNESCSCGWGDFWEPSVVWYTNSDWFTNDKGERDTKGTLVFAHNANPHTVQVCRSPLTWLPNWMVADKDLWVGDDPEDNV